MGALLTGGVDRSILDALNKMLEAEGAMLEIVAPTVGGVEASDGTRIEAHRKIGGGPSCLTPWQCLLPGKEPAFF